MEYVCKTCKKSKPCTDFPVRRWKTQKGELREGPHKSCYECRRLAEQERYNAPASKKRAARLAHYQTNHEASRAYGLAYYQANRERWLDRENGWRFSERARQFDEAYRQQPEVIEAARERGKAWRATHKARLVVKTRRRQQHVARATPGWADSAAILAVYENAERLTKETGERHEVDHEIPLQGKNVCGLHVETNLRVITATANRRKGHKFEPMTSLSSARLLK
jgi:hypothetical protein